MILGHQARILTERAQKAVRQLHPDPHNVDVLTVDASTLQPPSTAYSTSGTRLHHSSSPGRGQATTDTTSIRSRIKQQMGLRKVCHMTII